uniref:Uncharacterized protein n=1 Tax=Candidatus Kentrum sp. LFY TaxID=2126342 RepID=A0A450UFD6_9GAMM|nr:MAG: hypothetical protein BECKLFY1418A_GA0070994_10156 [Candidatus Kentron sp. LFY]
MRPIANDYGGHPNFEASRAPENANGATSSITYVDERGSKALRDSRPLCNSSSTIDMSARMFVVGRRVLAIVIS